MAALSQIHVSMPGKAASRARIPAGPAAESKPSAAALLEPAAFAAAALVGARLLNLVVHAL